MIASLVVSLTCCEGLNPNGACDAGKSCRRVCVGLIQAMSYRALRVAVRFLDDVIDATPYFFKENEEPQKSERSRSLSAVCDLTRWDLLRC